MFTCAIRGSPAHSPSHSKFLSAERKAVHTCCFPISISGNQTRDRSAFGPAQLNAGKSSKAMRRMRVFFLTIIHASPLPRLLYCYFLSLASVSFSIGFFLVPSTLQSSPLLALYDVGELSKKGFALLVCSRFCKLFLFEMTKPSKLGRHGDRTYLWRYFGIDLLANNLVPWGLFKSAIAFSTASPFLT